MICDQLSRAPNGGSRSLLVATSVFGDDTVAAMIDRLVHHADVIALKGDSYRLKDRDLGRVPAATTEPGQITTKPMVRGSAFNCR